MLVIHTESLSKIYESRGAAPFHALSDASIQIERGQYVALTGPSGSGKTTLLTLLACLDKPTSGSYLCLGQPVHKWSEKFLTQFRQQHIGVIFQQFNLIEGLTAAQNIALPLLPLGLSPAQQRQRVNEVAAHINIEHKLLSKVELLSGGEQQRVAIARALVAKPAIIFADEPTAHLDAANAEAVLKLLAQIKQHGGTLIMATHDVAVSQHPMMDMRIAMANGLIQQVEYQKNSPSIRNGGTIG